MLPTRHRAIYQWVHTHRASLPPEQVRLFEELLLAVAEAKTATRRSNP
jgi:hypothetical protein